MAKHRGLPKPIFLEGWMCSGNHVGRVVVANSRRPFYEGWLNELDAYGCFKIWRSRTQVYRFRCHRDLHGPGQKPKLVSEVWLQAGRMAHGQFFNPADMLGQHVLLADCSEKNTWRGTVIGVRKAMSSETIPATSDRSTRECYIIDTGENEVRVPTNIVALRDSWTLVWKN